MPSPNPQDVQHAALRLTDAILAVEVAQGEATVALKRADLARHELHIARAAFRQLTKPLLDDHGPTFTGGPE